MTRNFASLALARLYDKQGYSKDALEMYKALDTDKYSDKDEIADAIIRLQAVESQKDAGAPVKPFLVPVEEIAPDSKPGESISVADVESGPDSDPEPANKLEREPDSVLDLSAMPAGSKEGRMSVLLEKWLMLMVMQKRVDVFKNIKSRL